MRICVRVEGARPAETDRTVEVLARGGVGRRQKNELALRVVEPPDQPSRRGAVCPRIPASRPEHKLGIANALYSVNIYVRLNWRLPPAWIARGPGSGAFGPAGSPAYVGIWAVPSAYLELLELLRCGSPLCSLVQGHLSNGVTIL